MVMVKSPVALFSALLAVSNAYALKEEAREPEEIFSLAPGYPVPENATDFYPEFGRDLFEGESPIPINPNPLNHRNLFRRQAGAKCTFYRSGEARTCVTQDNKCCVDPNNAQDGWCCAPTAGCGPGTGSLGKCTTRISWDTTTMWATSSTTVYSTVSSNVGGGTSWTTRLWTEVVVVTRSDVDTATEWATVTVTAANGKAKRAVETSSATAPVKSSAIPASTTAVATATPAVEKQQVELRAAVTKAPKVFIVKGQLYKRQVLHTDTSTITVTRTSYITSSVIVTSLFSNGVTSTTYSTTTSTRTSALNAKTTVTSTLTMTVRPGESVPINPVSPAQTGPRAGGPSGGGSGGGSSGGLSTGAKAGIGGGVAGGALVIIAIIGVCFVRRRKNKNNANNSALPPPVGPAPMGHNPGAGGPMVGGAAATHYAPEHKTPYGTATSVPGSPPPASDPRYSQMTQTPINYGTPSPAPQYTYPTQPGTYSEMSATPAPFAAPPQSNSPHSPPGSYAYPRPPSPSSSPPHGNMHPPHSPHTSAYGYQSQQHGGYAQHGGQPQEIYQSYQAPPQEMPAGVVHSPVQSVAQPVPQHAGPPGQTQS